LSTKPLDVLKGNVTQTKVKPKSKFLFGTVIGAREFNTTRQNQYAWIFDFPHHAFVRYCFAKHNAIYIGAIPNAASGDCFDFDVWPCIKQIAPLTSGSTVQQHLENTGHSIVQQKNIDTVVLAFKDCHALEEVMLQKNSTPLFIILLRRGLFNHPSLQRLTVRDFDNRGH
jgi:hypothetical protein